VSFWAAGDGGNSVSIHGMIWDSTGAVLASGPGVTTTGGNQSNPGGDGAFHTDTLSSPIFIAGGTQIYIGWQPNNSLGVDWAYNGGDHSPDAQQHAASGAPASFAGHATESPTGAVAAYATYTPGSVYADNGAAFVGGVLVYVDDGAAWQLCGVYVDDGAAWQQIA
jgi:hypothetical protein